MERTLILFFATLVVFGTAGGQAQLLYATNSTVNVTRTGCGSTKLCVQTPDACDPAGSSACLFSSSAAKNPTTNDFSFQLSGNTMNATTITNGSVIFVGLELTLNTATGPGIIFACIQNNSAFSFRTFTVNSTGNVNVTMFNGNVTQIRGSVNTTKIQCEFDVANLTTTSLLRSQNNAFYINLLSGILTADGILTSNQMYRGGLLDLANPSANIANTTTAPNATVSSGPNQAFHSGGVLLLTGILSLAFLKA